MAKQFLTLNPTNRAGVFNRSARDEKGVIKEQMTFQLGVHVDMDTISKPMMNAICDDIGNQILVALANDEGVVKINRDATNQLVLEIADAKVRNNKNPKSKSKMLLTVLQLKALDERVEIEKRAESAELEAMQSEEAAKKAADEAAAAAAAAEEEAKKAEGAKQ